jgi:hypothetical protein
VDEVTCTTGPFFSVIPNSINLIVCCGCHFHISVFLHHDRSLETSLRHIWGHVTHYDSYIMGPWKHYFNGPLGVLYCSIIPTTLDLLFWVQIHKLFILILIPNSSIKLILWSVAGGWSDLHNWPFFSLIPNSIYLIVCCGCHFHISVFLHHDRSLETSLRHIWGHVTHYDSYIMGPWKNYFKKCRIMHPTYCSGLKSSWKDFFIFLNYIQLDSYGVFLLLLY